MQISHRLLIQSCQNCHQHQWCTRHKEERYLRHYTRVLQYFASELPHLQVHHPTKAQLDFLHEERVRIFGEAERIQTGKLGSFQIFLDNILIFSKHQTKRWPKLDELEYLVKMGLQEYSQSQSYQNLIQHLKQKFEQERKLTQSQSSDHQRKQSKSKPKQTYPCEYHHKRDNSSSSRHHHYHRSKHFSRGTLDEESQPLKKRIIRSRLLPKSTIRRNEVGGTTELEKQPYSADNENNDYASEKFEDQAENSEIKREGQEGEVTQEGKMLKSQGNRGRLVQVRQPKRDAVSSSLNRNNLHQRNNLISHRNQNQYGKKPVREAAQKLKTVTSEKNIRVKTRPAIIKGPKLQQKKEPQPYERIGKGRQKLQHNTGKPNRQATEEENLKLVDRQLGRAYRQKFKGLSQASKDFIVRFLKGMPGHSEEVASKIDQLRIQEHTKKGKKIQNLIENYISTADGKKRKRGEGQNSKKHGNVRSIIEQMKQIQEQKKTLQSKKQLDSIPKLKKELQSKAQLKSREFKGSVEDSSKNVDKIGSREELSSSSSRQKSPRSKRKEIEMLEAAVAEKQELEEEVIEIQDYQEGQSDSQESISIDLSQRDKEESQLIDQIENNQPNYPTKKHLRKTFKQSSKKNNTQQRKKKQTVFSDRNQFGNQIQVQSSMTRSVKFKHSQQPLRKDGSVQSSGHIPSRLNVEEELRRMTMEQFLQHYSAMQGSDGSKPMLCVIYPNASGKIQLSSLPQHIPLSPITSQPPIRRVQQEPVDNQSAVVAPNQMSAFIRQYQQDAQVDAANKGIDNEAQTKAKVQHQQATMSLNPLQERNQLEVRGRMQSRGLQVENQKMLEARDQLPINQYQRKPSFELEEEMRLREEQMKEEKARQVAEQQMLKKYRDAGIVSQFLNIPHQHTPFAQQVLKPSMSLPYNFEQVDTLQTNRDIKMALCSALQIGSHMIERLFDNKGKSEDGKIRAWIFYQYWGLTLLDGDNWLEAIQHAFQKKNLSEMVDMLTGSAVLTLPTKSKSERIWKLSRAKSSLPAQLQEYQHYLCYPKITSFNIFTKERAIHNDKVYELLQTKVVESEQGEERIVKLQCECKDIWMPFENFVNEFEQVLVINCEQEMYHSQVNMLPQTQPYKTLYYFFLKVQEQTVIAMRCCFPQSRSQYTLTIYHEIEKNKYEWDFRVKGSHYSKTFAPGIYLFFAEGFHVRWDQNGEMLLNKGWIGIQSSRKIAVKHGKWLEPSKIGYQDMKELFMPMYDQVSHDEISRKGPIESKSRFKLGRNFHTSNIQLMVDQSGSRKRMLRTEGKSRSPIHRFDQSRHKFDQSRHKISSKSKKKY